MKRRTITWTIVLMLLLGACAWILFYPVLTTPMERRAWQALHYTGRSIVQFKRETGNWPKALDEVTNLPTRQFNAVPFEYNSESHTLALPAFFEKNPIRLISRGRYGQSERSGNFIVHLECIDELNISKSETAPDDYFFRNNMLPMMGTSESSGASNQKE